MTRVCAVPGCGRPGVVKVMASPHGLSFRTDHAQMPAWADLLRCWVCAGAELDRLIIATTPLTCSPNHQA